MKFKQWHFDVLFVLGCIGALVMLLGKRIGIEVEPEVAGVFGLLIAFILKQRDDLTEDKKPDDKKDDDQEVLS